MWKDALNIDVELINKEWKVYLKEVDTGNFQLARLTLIGNANPASLLTLFISDNPMNPSGFSEERYDEVVRELLPRAANAVERQKLMNEAESILMEQMSALPLFTPTHKYLIQPSVKGMPPNLIGLRNYKYVSLDPAETVWAWPK